MKTKRKNEIKKKLKMNRCRYCKSTENLTIDHKVPKILGGTDDISNLQCLCKRCNGMKSGLSHNQVMSYIRWFLDIQKGRGDKPYKLTYNSK